MIKTFEVNITRVIQEIRVLARIAQDCTFRMDQLRRSHGQSLHDIIFKK